MQNNLNEIAKIIKTILKVRVIFGDARKLEIETDSIDLIITSFPYVNALNYYRAQMYNMLWLAMDFDLFRKNEIGGHFHFIFNRFRLLSEYLGNVLLSMIEMNRVLKKDKLFLIVVRNFSLEYEPIESYKFFAEMGKKIGFKSIKTIFRNIDKIRKYTSADIGKIDNEYIVVMEKADNVANTVIFTGDDNFIFEVVRERMIGFRGQIKKCQGTSFRGRKSTKERILNNADKISEAIKTISEDINIKR